MANCNTTPSGQQCLEPSDWSTCRPWDLSQQDRLNCYADSLQQSALQIAGAPINVFKLLGVHEQTKLVDLTGMGEPISGGDAPGYPASNAFTTFNTLWKSKQSTTSSVLASTFIGYDFGIVKIPNGRQRYGIEANIRQHITTIKIKQSSNPIERAAKVRIERSDNGNDWYGVAVVALPNNDSLNVIHFKQSVPNRFWRLRPIGFTTDGCTSWGIQALEMYDYSQTALNNIQDPILLENRDRDYQQPATLLKGYYDLINVSTDLSRFGIEIPTASYQIKINFNACIIAIGRPIVIGDILELPSETQYTPDLRPVKRYLEVTDVTWDAASYTPGWMPTMLLITTAPALASQETQDIFGDLAKHVDSSGLFDNDDGNNPNYQDYSNVDQTIAANSKTQVPERGSEGSNVVREFSAEELDQVSAPYKNVAKLGFKRNGLYVEDAIPQNGLPYTEGPTYPQSPKNGDYHRLTYEGLASDVPPALYRWSTIKNRWIYLETDRRLQFNNQKAVLEEYTTSANKIPAREIK